MSYQPSGLSPRGRGNQYRLEQYFMDQGLSPRGRGNPQEQDDELSTIGSIPAWAGEPIPAWSSTSWTRVYPRVGGGTYW